VGHSPNALTHLTGEVAFCQDVPSHRAAHNLKKHDNAALQRSEFCFDYLPLLSLSGKHCVGFEIQPAGKSAAVVNPNSQYSLDEDLASLGQLLHQAAKQLQFWQTHFLAASGMRLWVSVTQSQWLSPNFIELCQSIAQQPGWHQHGLVLEVKYAALPADIQHSAERVKRLKSMGFKVQVCNFMPSHSALTRLESCGITMAKLEQDVFRKLAGCSETQSFFSQVLQKFNDRNIEVTLPSIETPEQVSLLTQLDCNQWQTLCGTRIKAKDVTLMLYADSQVATALLGDYLSTMNSLSKVIQTYLGTTLVTDYWQVSRPDSPWLTPNMDIWVYRGCLHTATDYNLSPLQIDDLQQWTRQFINKCQSIVRGIPQLLKSSAFTPAHAQLLGIQEI